MYHHDLCLLVLAIFCSSPSKGLALRCWTCSSDRTSTCLDPFNATNYTLFASQPRSFYPNGVPVLSNCTKPLGQNSSFKQVCLKQVYNTPVQRVIRNCTTVPFNFSESTCPNTSSNLDFCGYCDHDGCNDANGVKSNFLAAIVIPFVSYLCLRD